MAHNMHTHTAEREKEHKTIRLTGYFLWKSKLHNVLLHLTWSALIVLFLYFVVFLHSRFGWEGDRIVYFGGLMAFACQIACLACSGEYGLDDVVIKRITGFNKYHCCYAKQIPPQSRTRTKRKGEKSLFELSKWNAAMQTKIKWNVLFWCVCIPARIVFFIYSFIHDFSFPPNQRTIFSILMDFCHVNTKLCFIFTFTICCCCSFFLGQLKPTALARRPFTSCAHHF